MSIYSANRSAAVGTVAESKAFTSDINKIMYESEVNSMRIFEACMKYDFGQVQGLREGTLLESEIAALDEASKEEFTKAIKKAMDTVKAKLKEAWNKLLNWIGEVYRKTATIAIKRFEKIDESKLTGEFKFVSCDFKSWNDIYGKLDHDINHMSEYYGMSRTDVVAKQLGKSLGSNNPIEQGKYLDEFKKKYFTDKSITLSKANVKKEIISNLEVKDVIKSIKKKQAVTGYVIDGFTAKLIKHDDVEAMSKLNEIASGFQTAISTIANTEIKLYRFGIGSYIKYLNAIIKNANTSAKNEAFMLEADAVIDQAECDLPDVIDSDDEFNKMVADTIVDVEDLKNIDAE